MVWTDYGFSTVRDWMLGNSFTVPSGMLVGTGSSAPTFSDLKLNSGLGPTLHPFSSTSGLGNTVQFEYIVNSGDIMTGSVIREIGMVGVSGGNLFFRDLVPQIELFGSAIIDSFLDVTIK